MEVIGTNIDNHLLLNVTPENKANDVIGEMFGGWGINLNQTDKNTKNKINVSFLFIILFSIGITQHPK